MRKTEQILEQVMEGLNMIIADQVKHRTCQQLAPELHCYLARITQQKQKPEDKEPAESMPLPGMKTRKVHEGLDGEEQGTFLFETEEQRPSSKKLKLKKKVKMLESLLEKYDHMSSNCRTKIQPVQSYLHHHLEMLKSMVKKCDRIVVGDKPTDAANEKIQRHAKSLDAGFDPNKASVDIELPAIEKDALTTENSKKIDPNFDVDKFIQQNMPKSDKWQPKLAQKAINSKIKGTKVHIAKEKHKRNKQNVANVSNWEGTEKYKRLVETANTIKRKRDTEERLGELFGRNRKRSLKNEKYHTIKSKNKEIQDLRNVNFETPVVLSLDN